MKTLLIVLLAAIVLGAVIVGLMWYLMPDLFTLHYDDNEGSQ